VILRKEIQDRTLLSLLMKVSRLAEICLQLLIRGRFSGENNVISELDLEYLGPDALEMLENSPTRVYNRLVGYLDCLAIFINSEIFDFSIDPTDENQTTANFCSSVLDLTAVPLLRKKSLSRSELKLSQSAIDFTQEFLNTRSSLKALTLSSLKQAPSTEFFDLVVTSASIQDLMSYHASIILASLFSIASTRDYLVKKNSLPMLVTLVQIGNPEVSEQAMKALSICSKSVSKHVLRQSLKTFNSNTFKKIAEISPVYHFYYDIFIHALCDYTPTNYKDCSLIHMTNKTKHLSISPCGLKLRNDLWTFESALANKGAKDSGKWVFEVFIETEGIIQIGWANISCIFDPEAGTGVGGSIFCDLSTTKTHIRVMNSYGENWAIGDTISALLDLDKGEILYLRNGRDMGIAFTGVENACEWFPAISLASGQSCKLSFG
ncbi:hypothetical protein HK096_005258, partial [Nowakowskiella sp. JEL0078]